MSTGLDDNFKSLKIKDSKNSVLFHLYGSLSSNKTYKDVKYRTQKELSIRDINCENGKEGNKYNGILNKTNIRYPVILKNIDFTDDNIDIFFSFDYVIEKTYNLCLCIHAGVHEKNNSTGIDELLLSTNVLVNPEDIRTDCIIEKPVCFNDEECLTLRITMDEKKYAPSED